MPYEVCAATWALLQEARAALTKQRGGSVSDDDFMETLARTLLAGGSDDGVDQGRAPYQIAITVCERCRTATQRAGSDEVVIDEPRWSARSATRRTSAEWTIPHRRARRRRSRRGSAAM